MDYQLFRKILSPYLVDNMYRIQEAKKYLNSIAAQDAFDKKFLTVLNNIIDCLETSEAIKSLALNILEESDFFADTSIHKTTKSKYLDKIISDSNYIEHTKSFNLSIIQTYVEKIIHKQLYEINIKIEENQRSLNKIESAYYKTREDIQQNQTQKLTKHIANRSQTNSIAQTKSLERDPQKSITEELSEQPRQNIPKTQDSSVTSTSSFLLIELDQKQCAITYSNIVEILKFDKPVPEKVLKLALIPHNKLVGFARGSSVLRKVSNVEVDKKQLLNNMNATLPNKDEKRFAVVINRGDEYQILFVDYIVYAEPVDGQKLGDYVKTVEGEYRVIN